MQRHTLHAGDNAESLRQYPDNYFHAVITDPPYGLGRAPDALEMLSDWLATGHHDVKSKSGFMGRAWDAFIPQPALWREVLRVMRPGAHLLTFGGTRTYDLLTLALRIAGFEIRDCIYWLYGSGFPKSHNVSKAIDKMAGAEREVIGERRLTGNAAYDEGEASLYGSMDAETPTRGAKVIPITAPSTEAARQWDGWGTALKPSAEPIVLARKPLAARNTAENVLRWRAGALNIDAGRVEVGDDDPVNGATYHPHPSVAYGRFESKENGTPRDMTPKGGRWPANVILDDEAAAALDAQTQGTRAEKTSATGSFSGGARPEDVYAGGWDEMDIVVRYSDSGGASRFFYCAKASRRDRDEGLDSFPLGQRGAMDGNAGRSGRRTAGDGVTPIEDSYGRNMHPTVKPVSLMRYLCRLITPEGGVILDPFAGSGSTGKAAMYEDFYFVGMEREPEYVAIATARIEHAAQAAEAEKFATQPALPLAA